MSDTDLCSGLLVSFQSGNAIALLFEESKMAGDNEEVHAFADDCNHFLHNRLLQRQAGRLTSTYEAYIWRQLHATCT